MSLLDDHAILLTGAGSGLGLGVVRYCLSEGASIAVLEIDEKKAAGLSEEFGDEVLIVQGDACNISDLEVCRRQIVDRFGRLDAVIGCQGIYDGLVPLTEIPIDKIDALFHEIFDTNVKGYILTARMFVDLVDAQEGAFVFTTSTAAFAADGGGVCYSASKGAIRSLVQQLSYEFAPRVRVNAVAPAGVANSQLRGPKALGLEHHKQSDIPKDALMGLIMQLMPLKHLATPEEYGPLYAFLASKGNRIMTGQTVVADQGLLNRTVLSVSQG